MIAPSDITHSRQKNVILCVDDDPQVLDLMDAYLTSRDYVVLTASDRESTLKTFLNNHVDAIVTDFEMSEMTGEDVIVSLRALKPGIPALVFSGSGELPPTLLTLADVCIRKPAIMTLPSKLEQLLKPGRPLPSAAGGSCYRPASKWI
jgi:DNA-binding NtrC family response regulator